MSDSTTESYDYLFKIVIVGDSGVGKTNIISRYIMDVFLVDSKTTIGVEFSAKCIEKDDKIIKAQIWDTAGQERYRAITSTYYRGASGAIIVFDVSNRETFTNLEIWINELSQQMDSSIPIMIIANKIDLVNERVVSTEEAMSFAQQHNMAYLETSAMNSMNIDALFAQLIDSIYEKAINDTETKENQKIKGEIADCKKELIRIEEVGQTEKKCSC